MGPAQTLTMRLAVKKHKYRRTGIFLHSLGVLSVCSTKEVLDKFTPCCWRRVMQCANISVIVELSFGRSALEILNATKCPWVIAPWYPNGDVVVYWALCSHRCAWPWGRRISPGPCHPFLCKRRCLSATWMKLGPSNRRICPWIGLLSAEDSVVVARPLARKWWPKSFIRNLYQTTNEPLKQPWFTVPQWK